MTSKRKLTGVLIFTILVFTWGCSTPIQKNSMKPKGMIGIDTSAPAGKGRKLALLIGVGSYKDTHWNPLKYPESDVAKLKAVLEKSGNFDEVFTLKGSDATRANILIGMEQLRKINKGKDDILTIYFSGHGTLDRDQFGNLSQYFVSHDAQMDSIAETAISMKKIFNIFDNYPSEKKVLILASCYSGAGKSVLRNDILTEIKSTKSPLSNILPPLEQVSKASIILSSSTMGDVSYENEELKGDIYTHFFIEGLTTGDANQDGAVTATEAHSHARYSTYLYTKGKQKPAMYYSIEGKDPINLSGEFNQNGKPVIYDYSDKYTAVDVLIDGNVKGQLPGSIPVEPGTHNIAFRRFYANAPFSQTTINVRGNERLNVDHLISNNAHKNRYPVGFRAGRIQTDDFNSSIVLETFYKYIEDEEIYGVSFDWEMGGKYLSMSEGNLEYSGYMFSNTLLLNFFNPFTSKLTTYAGPGIDIGVVVLESKIPGFSINHSQFLTPFYANAGIVYRGKGFYLSTDAKYYFSTRKSFEQVSEDKNIENRVFGFDGLNINIGITYFF
ncbi:MAG: caspase family protein [Nitrospinota bacterium]